MLNKMLANLICQYIVNIIHYDQLDIPRKQECFSINKSVNMTYHINRMKDKKHMTISKDTEQAFDKVQHSFKLKILNKFDE
jgi:hypothetical protein